MLQVHYMLVVRDFLISIQNSWKSKDLFIVLVTRDDQRHETSKLHKKFNEVYFLSKEQFSKYGIQNLTFGLTEFDIIDLQYHETGHFIKTVGRRWPSATIIFSPMESQIRALNVICKKQNLKIFLRWRFLLGSMLAAVWELFFILRANKIVTVSESDCHVLAPLKKKGRVQCIPTCVPKYLPVKRGDIGSHHIKQTIVFFAFFGSRTNQEALKWFISTVHPNICKILPDYNLKVVGHGINENLRKYCELPQINVVGSVPSIYAALNGSTIGIAPALSGSGARGKIHQYASYGLPCVASSIASDGLNYRMERVFVCR